MGKRITILLFVLAGLVKAAPARTHFGVIDARNVAKQIR